MASQVEISNMALGHLGVGKSIASVTEASNEARACLQFFDTARDAVLRDHPWSFAKKTATLALIETDPNDRWGYRYRVPSDCVFFRRIISALPFDTNSSQVQYELEGDTAGETLLTDIEDAECEYTERVTNGGRYRPDFTLALSWRLAFYIAPRLCGTQATKLGERAWAMYSQELSKAQSNAANESPRRPEPEADSIRARY